MPRLWPQNVDESFDFKSPYCCFTVNSEMLKLMFANWQPFLSYCLP